MAYFDKIFCSISPTSQRVFHEFVKDRAAIGDTSPRVASGNCLLYTR
jgi:hypothetical protein